MGLHSGPAERARASPTRCCPEGGCNPRNRQAQAKTRSFEQEGVEGLSKPGAPQGAGRSRSSDWTSLPSAAKSQAKKRKDQGPWFPRLPTPSVENHPTRRWAVVYRRNRTPEMGVACGPRCPSPWRRRAVLRGRCRAFAKRSREHPKRNRKIARESKRLVGIGHPLQRFDQPLFQRRQIMRMYFTEG